MPQPASPRPDRLEWPVRKFALGDEPGDNLSSTTTPAERLQMMWPLAQEAWSIAGWSLPEYSRSETPVKVLREADGTT